MFLVEATVKSPTRVEQPVAMRAQSPTTNKDLLAFIVEDQGRFPRKCAMSLKKTNRERMGVCVFGGEVKPRIKRLLKVRNRTRAPQTSAQAVPNSTATTVLARP